MNITPAQKLTQERRRARRLAMQALYQWQLTQQAPAEIEAWFKEDDGLAKVDEAYFQALLHGVVEHCAELDAEITPHLDRSIDRVDPVERALLRMACYELCHRLDVPQRVVLNEAIDLAKKFGAEQSFKFVNGVLDKLEPGLRKEERAAARY